MGLNYDRPSISYDDGCHRSGANERAPKIAVLVLGMHRSGTSSVSGTLVRLGGAAPTHLMGAHADNEKGFWESEVVTALNEEILAAGASNWRDWRKFDCGRIDAPTATTLRARAKEALLSEFGGARLPIVKDPRLCRLMQFWSAVFEDVGWSLRAVLPIRSPLEVALSLKRRDGIALSSGCLIWLRHVLDAEIETRRTPRAVLKWDDFLGNRRRVLERLGEQLDLAWPHWSQGSLSEIDEFVSPDLRHEIIGEDDWWVHPAINDLVRETYTAILELIEDPTDGGAQCKLDDVRARFEYASGIFDQAMFELEEEAYHMRARLVADQHQIAAQLSAVQEENAATLDAARAEFASQLKATRDECATKLATATSQRQCLAQCVDDANRRITRAEGLIAYVADRYAKTKQSGFRNYLRVRFLSRTRSFVRQKELEAIRSSVYFDEEFYLEQNPDVRAFGLDAALHYLDYGGHEGRDPGPFFSTIQYLKQFPDVAVSGVNALAHYEIHGRSEKRVLAQSLG
jgi:hypothetical protein